MSLVLPIRKSSQLLLAVLGRVPVGFKRAGVATALCVASIWPAIAQAPLDVRVALVIGNSAYAGNMALANASNDAAAMSASLKRMGFTVIEVRDANRAQMEDAVKRMFNALRGKQGVGMLYYAGHGLQVDWKNYMVPVDAKMQTAKDVPAQTLDVGDVLDALKAAGSRTNIVILDACRDNPFAEKGGKGLAPVDAPAGTFLAYATAPGNVAEDGSGQNGLYTKHLLAELEKPVTIESVFKRVRLNVRKESNGRQIPWETTSLEDEFTFVPGIKVSGVVRGAQRDADFAEQKAQWDKIKNSTDSQVLFAFLSKWPQGLLTEIAQSKYEQLAGNQLRIQTKVNEKTNDQFLPAVARQLKIGDSWSVVHDLYTISEGRRLSDSGWITDYVVESKQGENYLVVGKSNSMWIPTARIVLTPDAAVVSSNQTFGESHQYDPPFSTYPSSGLGFGYKASNRTSVLNQNQQTSVSDFELEVKGVLKPSKTSTLSNLDFIGVESKQRVVSQIMRKEFVENRISYFTGKSRIPLIVERRLPEQNILRVETITKTTLEQI